ncbi:Nitrate transporter 1.3 [Triticum urartu]|uniref:Nitrate transporter 1.3 n=1 Tax=Triticum urartu TaxID=4572 RepID=M7ZPM7_TRIUA|nr:Nitrate transporter 1.3 [Triticum urartu]
MEITMAMVDDDAPPTWFHQDDDDHDLVFDTSPTTHERCSKGTRATAAKQLRSIPETKEKDPKATRRKKEHNKTNSAPPRQPRAHRPRRPRAHGLHRELAPEHPVRTGLYRAHGTPVSTGGFGDNGGCEGLVVDFKGRPVDKSRVGGWFGAGLILVTELAERVCVMGISMNLVTYLTGDMHLSSAKSANIVTNFMGTLNLLALLGGFVADAKFGRYRTIAVSATITAVLHGFREAKVSHTDRLRCLDKAAIAEADPATAVTVTEVEEVKMVVKLLPMWSTCILFWTIYSQMTTFSIQQAEQMDRRAGSHFVVPAGSLSVFLFLSVLLFTALNERLLVPLAARLTRRPQGLTSLQRVAAGLVLATLGMAGSALVEKKRRDASNGSGGVAVSALWLVPQFFLVGAGEAFAYVGQLEFFIREAPERMKSMSTGLFLATLAMGFFLSSLLVLAVDAVTRGAWIRGHLDDGRLDLFYWMLAVLGLANFAVFLVFASRHQYKRTRPDAATVELH